MFYHNKYKILNINHNSERKTSVVSMCVRINK